MTTSELAQTPPKRAQLLNGLRSYKRAIRPVAMKAKRTDAIASPLLGRSNTLPTMTWAPDAKKITWTDLLRYGASEYSVEPVVGGR
jgi:hypothetical protein